MKNVGRCVSRADLLYFGVMKPYFFLLFICLTASLCALDERLVLADGLVRRGMHELAATEYEAFLQTAPEDTDLICDTRFRLAECYERLGRAEAAQREYRTVADLSSGERRFAAQLRLAASLLDTKQPEAARPLLETLATGKASEKLRDAASYRLGLCYEALGRSKDAATLYNILAKKNGDYAEHAKLALAAIAVKVGKPKAALSLYADLLKTVSSEERKQEISAAAFVQAYAAEEFARAADFARDAGEKRLAALSLTQPAAWAALRADRPEEARVWLAADKVARSKATAERLALEGAIAQAVGDTPGAVTAYERLITEFPNARQATPAARTMLFLRAKTGDHHAFLKAYARVAALLDAKTVAELAPIRLDAALQIKDYTQAKAAATWLVDHAEAEQAAEASYRLGWLAQQEKDWARAGETWLRTAETWPKAPCAGRAAYAAAYAFGMADLPERADHSLRLALASGDESVVPEALMLKARGRLAENDAAGAASILDEYLTRFPAAPAACEAAYLRGLVFFNVQDFKAAEEHLGKALAVTETPGGPTPLDHTRRTDAALRRAQSLHALGRGDEAAALLQPLIGLKDAATLAPAYLRWLAEFRLERAEWSEAEAAARILAANTALAAADRVLAQFLLGRAAEGRNQSATAIAAYEAALAAAAEPTVYDADAAVSLGALRLAEGSHARAEKAFTLAVTRADTSTAAGRAVRARAFGGLAKAARAQGKLAEALRANMNLIIFFDDPEIVPEAFREAVIILEGQGRADEAGTLREECKTRYGKELN